MSSATLAQCDSQVSSMTGRGTETDLAELPWLPNSRAWGCHGSLESTVLAGCERLAQEQDTSWEVVSWVSHAVRYGGQGNSWRILVEAEEEGCLGKRRMTTLQRIL